MKTYHCAGSCCLGVRGFPATGSPIATREAVSLRGTIDTYMYSEGQASCLLRLADGGLCRLVCTKAPGPS